VEKVQSIKGKATPSLFLFDGKLLFTWIFVGAGALDGLCILGALLFAGRRGR
jgi:hypothetical protein